MELQKLSNEAALPKFVVYLETLNMVIFSYYYLLLNLAQAPIHQPGWLQLSADVSHHAEGIHA